MNINLFYLFCLHQLDVDVIVANTDAQALQRSSSKIKVQLGRSLTAGLGAGAKPDIGRKAAEEGLDDLMKHIGDKDMIFLTAGNEQHINKENRTTLFHINKKTTFTFTTFNFTLNI